MKKYQYDYYTINVPADAFTSIQDAAAHAIDEARDKARLYTTPCNWTSELVAGDLDSFGDLTFKVTRKRNK